MTPLIKLENLSVIYFLGKSNEVSALRNIDLEIYPGEFVIFFGPSGCGKSTLLYSIAGLETNIHGNILIEEKNLSLFKAKELEDFHRNKIGMIFQAFYLIDSLSVIGNVVLPQIFINKNRQERTRKALELLDYFGVKNQANKLPSKLSGGQQQRVAICRALMNDPSILLADEPVGNLDSASAQEVMDLLIKLNKTQRKTVVLVTHNPAYLDCAHRVFYMKDGYIIDTKINRHLDGFFSPKDSEDGVPISKDLELLARTYSNISSGEAGNLLTPFKAKEIVAEVITGMTSEEIAKIEKKVENLLLMGTNNSKDIFEFLDISPEKGGMGMDKRTAAKLADKINGVIQEIKLLIKTEEELKNTGLIVSSEAIIQLRQYLLDYFDVEIKDLDVLRIIDQIIEERLKNKIDRVGARRKLDLPIKKGGAGMDKRTAKKMARRLELLILGKYK